MANNDWRKDLDLLIDKNISELIKETKNYDYAIKNAKDKSKAQIWIALAILNHKINHIYLKCSDGNKKTQSNNIPKEELNKIIETLETL